MSSDDEEEAVPRKAAPSKYAAHQLRGPSFNTHNKPAELFRKDLISAMKLADSEQLQEGSYFLISDPWRQEWEKGVQVPVNMAEIMKADIRELSEKSKTGDFKIPHKMLHERVDETYKKGMHELTGMQQLAEQLVRYDLDDLDVCWLEEVNMSRLELGLVQINEWNMERVMEALEYQCHEKMTAITKTEEGLGIEYDEDVVCDVCRSPESEDTNEMVFCDGCDVCIHQACYGIQAIPEGSWLCRTCALGIKPRCLLCPQNGGAMKSTRSGTKWAHVSCALWIPEVSIGVPEKMEPITKISQIPPSRWALICCLCKERVGACIQCSVKTCKTAFHVTCGFQNGLEMKTILDETDEHDGVKLKAYCPKHTKKRERGQSESDADTPRKESSSTPKKELTQQEKANLRARKLKQLEGEFYTVVDVADVAKALALEEEIVNIIYVYWKLKRKSNWDKPLLTPKTEEADMLEKQQEDSLVARMKMFVHLRQDLERVRNLCYMIGKREKMKRQFFKCREYVFTSMVRVLIDKHLHLSQSEVDDIITCHHFDSFYDNYGLSVPDLPPEESEEADNSMEVSEVDDSKKSTGEGDEDVAVDVVDSASESALNDSLVPACVTDTSMEVDEESLKMLSRGERWSGEFVRTGFFKRRRHRKLDTQLRRKKMHRVSTSCSNSAVKIEPTETETTDMEDSVLNASLGDSEMEKTPAQDLLVSSEVAGEDRHLPPPIPKLVVVSPKGKGFPHRRHWHRKGHRGRKPWHVQKSRNLDKAAKLDLSTDEEPAPPCTAKQSEALDSDAFSLKKENERTPEPKKSSDVHRDSSKYSGGRSIEPILVKLEREASPLLRAGLRDKKTPSGKPEVDIGQVSELSLAVPESKDDVESVKSEIDSLHRSPPKPRRTDTEKTKDGKSRFEKASSPLTDAHEDRDDSAKGSSGESDRRRRKSSLQTRLKMNKVLSKLEESSDEDFEPVRPVLATFPRKLRQHRHSKRQHFRTEDFESEEASGEECEEEEDEKIENRLSRHSRQGSAGRQSGARSSEKCSSRPYTATIRPELNGLLRRSKLKVKESVKERVQNRLLKSRSHWRLGSNGLYDDKQQTLDTFFSKAADKREDSVEDVDKVITAKASSRVLHEINPEKSQILKNNIFGAHYTPRGSLSGYRIPKKNSSQSPNGAVATSPLRNIAPPGTFGGTGEHRSFRSEALVGSPRPRRKMDSMLEEKLLSKKSVGSLQVPEPDRSPVTGSDPCEQLTVDTSVPPPRQGYRSHSPLSSEGSHAFHSDSRESTPRRFTRSQLADDMVENAPSPNSAVGGSGPKMKLRDGWLKAAQFTS